MFKEKQLIKFNKTELFINIAVCLLILSVLICDKIQLLTVGGMGISVHKIFLPCLSIVLFILKNIQKKVFSDLDRLQKYTLIFMAVWLIYGILLYFLKSSRSSAAKAEVAYLFFNLLLVTCVFWLVNTKRSLEFFSGALRAATGILILIGLFEIMSGRHLWMSRFHTQLFADASNPYIATGTFYNENDFCFFLVATGLLFCFWKENLRVYKRVLYSTAQMGIFFILIINDSIISLVFYTIALITALLLSRIRLWKVFLVFSGIVLFKSFVAVPIRNFLIKIYMNVINGLSLDVLPSAPGSISQTAGDNFTAFVNQNGSIFYRLMLTLQGVTMGVLSWLLGVGPAGYADHVDPSLTGGYVNPHNWWVEIFANYGIIIFLGYLSIPLALLLFSFHRYKKSKDTEHAVFIGMLFAFFVCCIVPSSLIGVNFQWMLFAFFLCSNQIMAKHSIQRQDYAPN